MAAGHDLIDETIAGVREHRRGLFALGPDGVVVNVDRWLGRRVRISRRLRAGQGRGPPLHGDSNTRR